MRAVAHDDTRTIQLLLFTKTPVADCDSIVERICEDPGIIKQLTENGSDQRLINYVALTKQKLFEHMITEMRARLTNANAGDFISILLNLQYNYPLQISEFVVTMLI